MQMLNDSTVSQEERILAAAKELFVKKGFEETSMGDIAAAAGITRPALHYYFRTKERLFQAVFGGILQSLAPGIEDILAQDDGIMEKLSRLVDIYLDTFLREPSLPLFVMMEIQRDARHLVETAVRLDFARYVEMIASYFTSEMDAGRIRRVPLYVIFYTFFGLLAYPFLTRDLLGVISAGAGRDFESVVRSWKPYIVFYLRNLLSTGSVGEKPAFLCASTGA